MDKLLYIIEGRGNVSNSIVKGEKKLGCQLQIEFAQT